MAGGAGLGLPLTLQLRVSPVPFYLLPLAPEASMDFPGVHQVQLLLVVFWGLGGLEAVAGKNKTKRDGWVSC